MGIKVIGKDAGAAKQVTCKNCGSILEYLPIDVNSYTSKDYTGSSDTYYSINCPECNYVISVDRPL